MIRPLLMGILLSSFIASSVGGEQDDAIKSRAITNKQHPCERRYRNYPCRNFGVCISLPNYDYRCECRLPWVGKHCSQRDQDCVNICTHKYNIKDTSKFNPVCGSDGFTYLNICELEEAACQAKKRSNDPTFNQDRRNISFVNMATCHASEKCCAGDCASYRGKEYRTASGKVCQRWDQQTPHQHSYTSENYPNAGLEENYCRNPSGAKRAWCYTTKDSTRWEYCDVPPCLRYHFSGGCCKNTDCTDFRGKYATTWSGRTCKAWTETKYHPEKYPQHGLEANYCRNPSGYYGPWCYTTDPKKSWERCIIYFCG